MNEELKALLERWTKRTGETLLREMRELGVRDTEALRRSLKAEVARMGNAVLRAEFGFLTRGRFVDMGVGRGKTLEGMRAERRRRNAGGRKPKRWYSPAFYGRLNDLMGAVGLELMEEAIENLKGGINGT